MSEPWLWIVGQVVLAAAVWGAIRADIRNIHERVGRLESRFDRLMDGK